MLDKDRKMKSIVFMVIGIIFLLSLVVCIYITYTERDLKETIAEVTNNNVTTGSKKNFSIVYTVNGISYSSSFYTDDSLTVGDKIKIYYHEKDATTAKLYKTSLIIFICPIVGLMLCIIGLFKVLKKNKDIIKEVETSNEVLDELIDEPSKIVNVEESVIEDDIKFEENIDILDELSDFDKDENKSSIVISSELPKSSNTTLFTEPELPVMKSDEVSDEETFTEEVEEKTNQVNVLPNNYYISGFTLVYEEFSNHKEVIELKDIDKIVVTINSVGNVVKLVVYTEKIKCILTRIKNIDLDKMVNSLKNKMHEIEKDFEETIENKEY